MKRLLLILALLLLAVPVHASVCKKLDKLREEWVRLEEETGGGVFYSGPSEVQRLHALRQIMRQPASICVDDNKKEEEVNQCTRGTIDNNRCRQCPKHKDCEDIRDIQKAFHNLVVGAAEGRVGSRSGQVIITCEEPAFIKQDAQEGN